MAALPLVADVIKSRRAEGSRPGARSDPYKLALVIEGGGMAGVVVGGMVSAIQHAGVTPCFDAVYGTSAGAFAGAYLLAGQAPFGTAIFYEDLSGDRFISPLNPFRGRPIMDLDHLCFDVMANSKPIDFAAIQSSGVPLRVCATHAETAALEVLTDFSSREKLITALRASATIPVLASGPFDREGVRFYDGGLVAQIPYKPAIDDGFTHVFVLSSRSYDVNPLRNSPLDHIGVALQRGRLRPAGRALRARKAQINAMIDFLRTRHDAPDESLSLHWVALASRDERPSRSETDYGVLAQGALAGYRACLRSLGVDDAFTFVGPSPALSGARGAN